ncbi:MAG: acyl-CoA desaturase [Rhizobiaceae bacterium]
MPDSDIAPARGAERLDLPKGIIPTRISWANAIPIATIHLLALLALWPQLFSWAGLVAFLVGVPLAGQIGVTLCYHRLLAHRSFRVPKWFERVLVLIALCNLEGPPGRWVATHRAHHHHADTQPDPHSPLVNFLWSHIGWMVIREAPLSGVINYRRYASDIMSDPLYARLERDALWALVYVAQAALYFLGGFAFGWLSSGDVGASALLGSSLVVWGVILRTVAVWHITWSVNSLTHMFGYRSHTTDDDSRNNWVVALLSGGEGWHNNHHADPISASNQQKWWEIDTTYYMIRGLERIGLATNVVHTKAKRQRARAAKVTTSA